MSLATWKKEFYPVPADKVNKNKAVDHSLRKWKGLTRTNLRKHGVKQNTEDGRSIFAKDGVFGITTESCALCKHYFESDGKCPKCPLSIVRGGISCDAASLRGINTSDPYGKFRKGNPQPMISWLKISKIYVDEFGAQ